MKNIIKFLMLFCLGALFIASNAIGQNVLVGINPQNPSGIQTVGSVQDIQVSITNTSSTLTVGAFRLRPVMQIPSIVTLLPDAQQTGLNGYVIVTPATPTPGQIRICNSSNTLAPGATATFILKVVGTTIGVSNACQVQMAFGGASCAVSGPGTTGNNSTDDFASTTLTVIAAPPCFITGATAAAGAILCNGGTTTLTVNATTSAPTGALEYSINGGAYQASNTFTVPAGSYTSTVREASSTSCSATATAVVVAQPTALNASGSFSAICFGETSSVIISATGGTPPYTGEGTFTQSAGTQSYTVTDANGCSTSTSVTVTQAAAVAPNASVTTPIVIFGGTGAITVTGGTSYVITSGPTSNTTGATSGVFTGLLAGTYTFTATVAGCTGVTQSIVLSAPQPCVIAVSAGAGTIACNGGTTTLTATATDAIGSVEYSLNGGAYQASNTFTVAAGSYTITAREVSRTTCSATSTLVVVGQPDLVVASGSFSPICFGATSVVTISATGGTSPYTGTGTFNQVAGTQSYTVTDANGCAQIVSVTVTQAAQVATPTISSVNNGNNTFTLTAAGFTGSLLWSTGATTSSILAATAGAFTVTQTIAGCTSAAASINVTLGNAIADPAVGGIFVTNLSDATVSANSLLFTQNYKVKLPVFNLNQFTAIPSSAINFRVDLGTRLQLDPAFNLATAPLSNYFSYSAAIVAGRQIITGVQIAEIPADFDGIAEFNVRGTLTCTSTLSSAIVITNTSASVTDEDLNNNLATLRYTLPVTVTATPVNVTCFGAANGNINVVASPGTTIVFTNAGGTVVTAPFAPGTYTVTANATGDAPLSNTCSNSTTVTISQPALLVAATVGTTPSICNGGNTGSASASATGGTAPYSYTISGAANTTGAISGIFTGLTAGSYTITATDANGCTATTTAVVGQPTSTVPDIAIGSDVLGTIFATNGTAQTIVYNINEIAGNPAVGDTLRITKVAGFDITFNTALASFVIGSTNYSLDNTNWKVDNSNPAFISIILKAAGGLAGPGTINCAQSVNIAVTLTRNTTNISTFPLSARFRRTNGELNLANNFNSILFRAD